jgi:guanylate kinase
MLKETVDVDEKDLELNLDDFISGKSNILFITGFAGSGKSTLADTYVANYDCEHYELDCLPAYLYGQMTKDEFVDEDGLIAYINETKLEPVSNEVSDEDFYSLCRNYVEFLIDWCAPQKDKKFIIEGWQLYVAYSEDCEILKQYPIIVKGTSGLESTKRAIKRDSSSTNDFKQLFDLAKAEDSILTKFKTSLLEESFYQAFKIYENLWI